MHIIFQSLNFSDYNHTMLWAACCLGFFGFLRAGEFTVNSPFNPDIHLVVSDVQADSLVNPSSFRIHIKCSKTDPFRQGCHIYIGAGKRDLCPFRTLTQHLHVRGSTPGPLFLLSDGTPLHRQWLTSNIQSIFSAAGVPGCYTGHSFRIGAATSAASRGLPDHLIKTLGRWSSDAYQIYIHTPVSTIVGVASLLTWQVFLAYLSLFLVVLVGCLGTWVVRGQGFPQPWAPLSLSDLAASARRVPSAWNGGSWLGCGDLPAMRAVFYLGAGWPQWKPLGIPGTHLPLKRGSWLNLVKCNLTKLTTTSLAVKRSTSLAVKRFISLAVKRFTSLAVKRFTSLAVKPATSLAVHKLSGQAVHRLSG